MELTESNQGGWAVFRVTGKIDSATAPELEARVMPLIAGGQTRIIFDLAGVDYLSSAGLRILLLAGHRLGRGAPPLALAAVPDHVEHVFEVAGFTDLFGFFPSVAAALQAQGAPPIQTPGQ